jgi:prophage tail gpP-like protein
LEEGEHAINAIDRACRMRALLVTSTPDGNLLITRASNESSGVRLVEGENMTTFHSHHSWKERHSEVTIKAQVPGDDQSYGPSAAQLHASDKDQEINRYRPLIVIAEHGTHTAALQDRAKWENRVRMGRGKRGGCAVVGWRTGKDGQEGPLWTPTTMVQVTSERMDIDQEMLIVACRYKLDDHAGKITEITFSRREAFELVEGIGRSKLNAKLNDKTQKEKRKKKEGLAPSFTIPGLPR